jgi:hydroxymethylbilane synthase
MARIDDEDGPFAVVLAAAGLNRLGVQQKISEFLKCHEFVSAVGQGALAVEVRAGDEAVARLAGPLPHADTCTSVDAERAFLAAVEGGCSAPVSAHARVRNGEITINAFAASPDGSRVIRGERFGSAESGIDLALDLADELLKAGAGELLAAGVNDTK